jgi:tRNA nucleotidyltransferase (CCA-adding enzyme)
MLIKGQTLIDFDILTNAEMNRIRATFEGYNVNEDNLFKGELLIRVLGVGANLRSYEDLTHELSKTDFTFNAVAYNPRKGFKDPFGGLNHIEKNIVSFINNDSEKINPLALLPALSYYSEGEHTVHEDTKNVILNSADKISELPPALIREDLEKILMGKKAGEVLGEYEPIFIAAIGELNMLNEFGSGKPGINQENLLLHTFKSVSSSTPILSLRYALLFHELGKPDCYSCDSNGKESYFGHIERGRIYAERIMTKLSCPADALYETCYIIENREKVLNAEPEALKDLLDEFPADMLKLMFLFSYADYRADLSEKSQIISNHAMKFKKLASLI